FGGYGFRPAAGGLDVDRPPRWGSIITSGLARRWPHAALGYGRLGPYTADSTDPSSVGDRCPGAYFCGTAGAALLTVAQQVQDQRARLGSRDASTRFWQTA